MIALDLPVYPAQMILQLSGKEVMKFFGAYRHSSCGYSMMESLVSAYAIDGATQVRGEWLHDARDQLQHHELLFQLGAQFLDARLVAAAFSR